ncbi:MAG: hypothetical protein FWG52_09995 [Proteobacteria bacterium]|nr:hypothetical protein [Pseudomonadota bacterium]
MNTEIQSEIAKSSVKVAPPVAVSAFDIIIGNIDKVVMVVTLAYTLLMLVHLVYKFAWDIIDRRRQERVRAESKRTARGGDGNP